MGASLSGQAVARAFANLGGDTALFAPANATGRPADYPHLAAFLRGDAPSDQIEKTWAELGRAIAGQLEQRELVWVSTAGTAVHWLHLRVDARPKYYNWSPYALRSALRPPHDARVKLVLLSALVSPSLHWQPALSASVPLSAHAFVHPGTVGRSMARLLSWQD